VFKSIVVGTDGSKTADEAVRQAVELARATGAELHIVSAYRSALSLAPMPPDIIGMSLSGSIANVEADLERIAEYITAAAAKRADAEGVRGDTYVVAGDAADAVLDVAETAHADVVFVGNAGLTSAKRFFLGSVAGKVAHHAPCHVMIVHTTG
jgi:nucleotide-binding universal stress UspA family protein